MRIKFFWSVHNKLEGEKSAAFLISILGMIWSWFWSHLPRILIFVKNVRRIKPFLIIQNKEDNFINSNKQTKVNRDYFSWLLFTGFWCIFWQGRNDKRQIFSSNIFSIMQHKKNASWYKHSGLWMLENTFCKCGTLCFEWVFPFILYLTRCWHTLQMFAGNCRDSAGVFCNICRENPVIFTGFSCNFCNL